MAQTERDALCDLALQLGEGEPTLCGDWTVKDLVVHLLVRERSPAAAGIVLKPLRGVASVRQIFALVRPDVAERLAVRTVLEVLVDRAARLERSHEP